jgi:phi LC3 family holin
MINWKDRFKNKVFILSLVSAIILLAQLALKPLGISVNEPYIMSIVNGVLGILMILGIIIDPTTPGITDNLK